MELAVKATYLYRLAAFVTWPGEDTGAPPSPVTLCVQGADPFGDILDRLIAGRRPGGRPIVVKRVARLEPRSGCQIAYVAGGPGQSPAQALEAVNTAPVVTVTDEARGGAHGIVHLIEDGPRVRFSIDAAQASESGVTLSSKLMALAVTVKR
ncbi:YfiR family protein [Phenylobacterium sp.]|uniref:YfiR family protein n=1 Tax=Phenylobacterium sp. TaxID=1871053 RepID=UPI0025D73C76|nr:YfiR family protein [Phenylobacterium sp.]